jgi:HK97 family phage portal protein
LGSTSHVKVLRKMWNPFRKKETRQTLEEILIAGGALTSTELVTKDQALAIPAVSACVNLIADTVASLEVNLFQDQKETVKLIRDNRVNFLNDDTGDTMDGFQFKRAMVESYLLDGNAYAYINRVRNNVKSLHYIEPQYINIVNMVDPIFKDYTISIQGDYYRHFEFIKFLRMSKNGSTGKGVIAQNNKLFSVAYNVLVFQETIVKNGGNKKGFLKSETRLSEQAMNELKTAWKNLYQNNTDSVIVLNAGMDFKETTNTSVELQLNQQQKTTTDEICKLFLVPPSILQGIASNDEYNQWIKMCILPLITEFECALNKDLLLPSEKENLFFSFDVQSLMKADIETRYKAYEIATKNGILQIDEIRYLENYPPLGLNFVKLGLQDVLYNPETQEIINLNMNANANLDQTGAKPADNSNQLKNAANQDVNNSANK